jgi:hypothetical protein
MLKVPSSFVLAFGPDFDSAFVFGFDSAGETANTGPSAMTQKSANNPKRATYRISIVPCQVSVL